MAAVLCFLLLIQSWAAVNRVTSGEVARYEFKLQSGTSVPDATGNLGPLVFSNTNNVTWLAASSGIRINSPGSLECASAAPIVNSLVSNFTFEFWMSYPGRAPTEKTILMSIGNTTGMDASQNTGMPTQSVALAQLQNQFYYYFPSAFLSVGSQTVVGLTHWIFSSNFTSIAARRVGPPVYLNGTQTLLTSNTPPTTFPLAGTSPLQIAPVGLSGMTWYGDIHHFSIYSRLLSDAEILQNFQAGPADSSPYATNLNYTGPMDTPLVFSIGAYDLDFAFPAKNETQNCTLLTIPSLGTLTTGGVSVQVGTVVQQGQNFSYLGAVLGWGVPYTNFTFNCIDSTGRISQNATTVINLFHVDHPPTPNNQSINAVRANKTLIVLTGTNVDYYPMGMARVTQLPTNGTLYLASTPILANSTLPLNITTLNSKGQSQLYYLSDTTSGTDAGGQAILFTDSFMFEIASKPNGTGMPLLWSTTDALVNISVTNNLFSQASTVTLAEMTPNTTSRIPITLQGTNSLGLAFYAIIQTLPSHGQLYLPGSNTPLTQADLPQTAGTSPNNLTAVNLACEYVADDYYYGNDSFTFQLNETQTGWLSAVATLSLKITAVNQPPYIVFPANVNLTFLDKETKYIMVSLLDRDNDTSAPYNFEVSSVEAATSDCSLNISFVDNCSTAAPGLVVDGLNLSWACAWGSLHNVSFTASFFAKNPDATNASGLLQVSVTDHADGDPFSLNGVAQISYTVVKAPDPLQQGINQLRLYLQWGGIGLAIAAFCFGCCVACGRYQRMQVRKAMASNTYGGEATSLDRL